MRVTRRWNCAAWVVGLTALAGCAGAKLQNAWSDPAAGPFRPGDTFLAVAIAESPAVRRAAEDELVRQIGAERATAAYSVFADGEGGNDERARGKVRDAGFDYAVVLRPLSKRQEIDWVPGQVRTYPVAYRSFWGYYRVGWSAYEAPGYLRTDTVIAVEALVYALATDQVVWAAETELRNPANAQKAVSDVATAAIQDLRKRGLLPER